ncbi:MAG: endonuclease MutS2 [Bacteroidota bacterium]
MKPYNFLDALTKLEFEKITIRIRDYCSSDLGRELVDELRPSSDCASLQLELSRVTECKSILEADDPLPIDGIRDIRTALHRSAIEGSFLSSQELLAVGSTLKTSRLVKAFLRKRTPQYPLLWKLGDGLFVDRVIEFNIEQAIGDEGKVRDSASKDLKEIRRQIIVTYGGLRSKLESILRVATKEGLAQDEIITTRDGRMVIPVKVEHKHHVPGFVHSSSASGATVFIEPAETLELNNEIRTLLFQEQREIERILRTLTQQVREVRIQLVESLGLLAELDFLYAKGRYSIEILGSHPIVKESGALVLREGRHPILLQKHRYDEVIPLTVTLGDRFKTLIISGPNAGGKSVALKTVGLLSLMVQCGIHVPASPDSEFRAFNGVFVDIGDEQSIENDLSTFTSHLVRLKDILTEADENGLVLIDEIGAGTDPTEGGALAAAVLEELTRKGVYTVATTHHGALKVLAEQTEGVENGAMEFDQSTLTPTYRFSIGVPGSSYALEIAKRLGIPRTTLEKAKELLGEQATRLEKLLINLEAQTQKQKHQIDALEREKSRLKGLISLYENKVSSLDKATKSIRAQAVLEAEELIQKTNATIERLIKDIREKEAERTVVREDRKQLQQLRDEVKTMKRTLLTGEKSDQSQQIELGTRVRIRGTSEVGELVAVEGSGAVVLFGSMRTKISMSELEVMNDTAPKTTSKMFGLAELSIESVTREIDLRGMTGEEALAAVDKILDKAVIAGLHRVDIIHGKGTGALRKEVTKFLTAHPHVKFHRLGEWNEGGSGVTVVELVD